MLVQRSHCLHVLLGYPRSHTTLLQDVAPDTPPHQLTHGLTLAKHKSQTIAAFTSYPRSHMTLLYEVAYDHVSVEAHLTLGSKVTHDILCAILHAVSMNSLFALQFPHAAPSRRRRQYTKCIKSQSTSDHVLLHVAHDMRSVLRCRTRHPYLRSCPAYFYQRLAK